MTTPLEIAIVGAGIAGITCASQLQAAGYQGITIFEKSRGVGGRLTTRRMHQTCVDRGTCYISPKGEEFRKLVDRLIADGIVKTWTDTTHTLTANGELLADAEIYPRYVAPGGMNQIAKYLAKDLDIRFGQRAISIQPSGNMWRLILDGSNESTEILARTVILAIPAPQIVDLLTPISDLLPIEFRSSLKAVEFYPSIAVAAGYTSTQLTEWEATYPHIKSVTYSNDPILAWVGLDSSKRQQPSPPVFVLQSTADFATEHPDLQDTALASQLMLERASKTLFPWFQDFLWQEPHLWRYAIAKAPLFSSLEIAPTNLFLSIYSPAPLFCMGDWCRGRKVEDAFLSGLSVANTLKS
jgi:renalase